MSAFSAAPADSVGGQSWPLLSAGHASWPILVGRNHLGSGPEVVHRVPDGPWAAPLWVVGWAHARPCGLQSCAQKGRALWPLAVQRLSACRFAIAGHQAWDKGRAHPCFMSCCLCNRLRFHRKCRCDGTASPTFCHTSVHPEAFHVRMELSQVESIPVPLGDGGLLLLVSHSLEQDQQSGKG